MPASLKHEKYVFGARAKGVFVDAIHRKIFTADESSNGMTTTIPPHKSHKNRIALIFVLAVLLIIAGSFLGLKIHKAISAGGTNAQSEVLTILNTHSFPAVGGNWLTQFTTDGQAELKVEGIDGTFFEPTNADEQSDLEFLTLKCGDTEYKPVRQGNSYLYPNWSCEGFGYFSDKVLTQGQHYLKFTFGDRISYAYNTAGDSEWSERMGGTNVDVGHSIITDTNNNIIVTGAVNGTADLNGDGDTDDENETPSGTYGVRDGFISAFNSSGTFVWSKRLGGTGTDYGGTITTDTNNNVIVSGLVTGTADLNGDGDTDDENETPSGTYGVGDGFISAFNSSGTFQWSKRLGGTGTDYGYTITTDTNNQVIVIGPVTGTADLNGDGDTDDENETPSGTYGGLDAFISAFNSSGTFVWSKRLGGTGTDYGVTIAIDTDNNMIVAGAVTGTADLNGDGDTSDANETPSGTYGGTDIFISAFNSSGTLQWSKRFGGTSGDFGDTITTDTNNQVVVTGVITGTADLNGDDDALDESEVPSGTYGGIDVFISAFNSSGTFQWSKRLGGTGTDDGAYITTDTNNNVIVTGLIPTAAADLNGDDDTLDANETSSNAYDAFISVFNSSGTFVWSKRLGGTGTDHGNGVITDINNNVIVTGRATGTADLNGDGDTSDANETPSSTYGSEDAFISKIVILPIVSASAASNITMTSATLNGSIDSIGADTVTARGFEWGADTSYGTTVSESDSYGTGSFSTNISSLTCNTTYHFRTFTTNSQGTGYSSDTTFTASACPANGPPGNIGGAGGVFVPPEPPRSAVYYPDGTVVYLDTQINPDSAPATSASTPVTAPFTPTPTPEITGVPPMFTFTRGLWLSLQDPDVERLQMFLNRDLDTRLADTDNGSPGNETDYFGRRTFRAVQNFQLKYDITTEGDPYFGYVGPNTRPKLNELIIASGNNLESVPTASIPSTPAASLQAAFTRGLWFGLQDPDVEMLQIFLNQDSDTRVADTGAGSPENETDYFDSGTLQAVKNFQLKYGVSSESDPNFGYVGPNTRAKLNEIIAATGD